LKLKDDLDIFCLVDCLAKKDKIVFALLGIRVSLDCCKSRRESMSVDVRLGREKGLDRRVNSSGEESLSEIPRDKIELLRIQ
jgi:chloramphenicol 3-O-phosphotransferase